MYKEIVKEKRVVIGREDYFDILNREKKNIALVGPLDIGKSYLVKEYVSKAKNAVYVDLSRVGMTPEDFCVSFILHVASWHLGKDVTVLDDCKINEPCSSIVDQVKNELLKIKPGHKLLVELAFRFSNTLGKEVVIDEFWRLLDLNNFDAITDVMAMFKQFASTHSSRYILVGSAEKLMKDICKKIGFEVVEVKGLRLKDVGDDSLHHYSQGVPLYYHAIKERGGDVRDAFLTEALWNKGIIYHSCLTKLNDGLSRARGKGLLMSVLRILCESNGLRLSEVSRRIYRSAAVTKNLISRLEDVDLVVREGNLILFKDNVLKFWFRHYVKMIEFEGVPAKNELRKIEVDL